MSDKSKEVYRDDIISISVNKSGFWKVDIQSCFTQGIGYSPDDVHRQVCRALRELGKSLTRTGVIMEMQEDWEYVD